MKIIKLDSSVYNKIAAGEVVERPASVVKELVENSIDAGADKVEVSIRGGGLDEINVWDNGSGIEKDDLRTAFLPHATSKLKTAEDLNSILTLGFRGEALASIASISMVTLKSRAKGAEDGNYIAIRGGKIEEEGVSNISFGTEICVKNMFYNTPARYKFMKTASGEANDIKAMMQKIILANPHIAFTFSDENGVIYKTNAGELLDSISSIFSNEITANLIPLAYEKNEIKVNGYCSKSTYFKSNRTYQIFIINGRVSNNQAINSAISTAYASYLMKRNYPIVILNLTLPSGTVDVNVHPTKAEVRFSNNNIVFSAIYHAIKEALDKDIAERKMIFNTVNDEVEEIIPQNTQDLTFASDNGDRTLFVNNNSADDFESVAHMQSRQMSEQLAKNVNNDDTGSDAFDRIIDFNPFVSSGNCFSESSPLRESIKQNFAKILQKNNGTQTQIDECDKYKIIGQVFGTYLLIEYKENFIIVDQHAAVERLRYEKMLYDYEHGEIAVQPMLFPLTIDVTPAEYEIVSQKIDTLNKIGISLIPFGQSCFKLIEVPAILSELDLKKFIDDILSDKPEKDVNLVRERLMYKACRSSIKGNTYFDNDEIEQLMDTYFKNGIPLQCPHGRPAFIVYTKRELEKLFKRIV